MGTSGDKPVGVLSHCLRARNGGKKCYSEKTPTSERDNYVYRFNDGKFSVIGEEGEAEVWIKSLHSFDDANVYNNIKNSRPRLEP